MSKATEAKLGDLHGAVADLLTGVIREGTVIGVKEDGTELRATAPAAYVVAALAFLKNNNITADPGTNAALADLQSQLAARRQNGKATINRAAIQGALDDLDNELGGMLN